MRWVFVCAAVLLGPSLYELGAGQRDLLTRGCKAGETHFIHVFAQGQSSRLRRFVENHYRARIEFSHEVQEEGFVVTTLNDKKPKFRRYLA